MLVSPDFPHCHLKHSSGLEAVLGWKQCLADKQNAPRNFFTSQRRIGPGYLKDFLRFLFLFKRKLRLLADVEVIVVSWTSLVGNQFVCIKWQRWYANSRTRVEPMRESKGFFCVDISGLIG